MSEKQLTVAELMARAAAEGRGDAPKRRRRRSLEDGGVSVAELTGSLPKVEVKPAEPRHTSQPIDAPAAESSAAPAEAKPEPKLATPKPAPVKPVAAPKPAAAKAAEVAPVVSVVKDDDPVKLTTDAFPAQRVESKPEPEVKPAVKPVSEFDQEETGVLPVVVDKPAEAELEPVAEEDEDDGGRISIGSVIVMAVLGIVLGAAVFLGFKALWINSNSLLVGALAGAMTLGIVGLVHALRTERDGLSMTLAAITGLALTFGPLLIIGL
ncbi:hypothetical protein WG936_03235 [Corynebacterium sp. H127]|uniref:hypothetical protein n=1 Tax=Corynebacterium sp. H127 TaxID=3133418 RepID=UPI0030AB1223